MLPLRLLVCGKKVRMFSLCNKTNCIFITGALYAKQDSGFMDSELFLKWFQIIFLPHAKPTVENPALLLMDGHASHCSPEVIDCARENNVILLALVPHTTHLCQPLDVAVYNAFKNCLGKHVKDGQAIKGELWIPKKQVAKIITKPFEDAMSMRNIKAGFKKCGVVPYNPNAIDKERMLRNQLIPNLDVDLSLPSQNTREDAPQGQLAAALHNVPVLDLGDESEVVGVINNILDDSAVLEFEVLEDNATAVDSIPLTPSSNAPTTSQLVLEKWSQVKHTHLIMKPFKISWRYILMNTFLLTSHTYQSTRITLLLKLGSSQKSGRSVLSSRGRDTCWQETSTQSSIKS